MANFWHRSSGDSNEVLIDPAEDWSQVWWSRDHFPSRELIFNRFPITNFEIAAVDWSARSWLASQKSGFSKIHMSRPLCTVSDFFLPNHLRHPTTMSCQIVKNSHESFESCSSQAKNKVGTNFLTDRIMSSEFAYNLCPHWTQDSYSIF